MNKHQYFKVLASSTFHFTVERLRTNSVGSKEILIFLYVSLTRRPKTPVVCGIVFVIQDLFSH
jgi:hypothetical protein